MKIAVIIAAVTVFLSARAVSGEMFGSIVEGTKAVGEKVKVEVTAGAKSSYTAETDKNGAYRIFVKEKGKCTFTVYYKEQSPTAEVFSYDKSLRYDWVLELKDGKYQLKRK